MNKTLVISGCSKGIGLATTELFASKGFNIAGCARNKTDLLELFKRLSETYPEQEFFFESCDVTDKKMLQTFAADSIRQFKRIDVLVNNAGMYVPGEVCSEDDGIFEKQLNTNLGSAYHLTRGIAPAMKKQEFGHIFNVCSVASIKAFADGGSYSISKFALYGMSKVLREELKPHNIKVTSLLPGATLTASWDGSNAPGSRLMKKEDVAKMIWAAYELSDYSVVEEMIMRPLPGDF